MQFEIYGLDLNKEAELKPTQQLSAAAQAALDKYSVLPEQNTSWKQQPIYKQREKSVQQREKEYYEIKEKPMTRELKAELEAIQFRNTTHRYAQEEQKLDSKVAFGTVIEGPAQFYKRIPKKQRPKSMVDSVLRIDDKMEEKMKQIDKNRNEERVQRMKMRNRKGKKK